ncbi:hypothetical protein BGX26_003279 [Mortierella sp. AD094]|nr:hypothetical protein BGX26_003279 [Mortierella sp. AD094]
MTSLMIQEIMVSCPQLNTFIATYLEARDILGIDEEEEKSKNVDKGHGGSYTRDWTCVGLKELRFQICGLEGRPEWQRLVLKQLARLTKLEWLNVANCAKWGSSVRDGLDLRLGSGLDILSSLKRLESLMFLGLRQEMNEEDVRWPALAVALVY